MPHNTTQQTQQTFLNPLATPPKIYTPDAPPVLPRSGISLDNIIFDAEEEHSRRRQQTTQSNTNNKKHKEKNNNNNNNDNNCIDQHLNMNTVQHFSGEEHYNMLLDDHVKFEREKERQKLNFENIQPSIEPPSLSASSTVPNPQIIERAKDIINYQNEKITLNVNGTIFTTTRKTLLSEESIFHPILRGEFNVQHDDKGAILFDQSDPKYFKKILQYLRNKKSTGIIPKDYISLQRLKEEAEYFCISSLAKKTRKRVKKLEARILKDTRHVIIPSTDSSSLTECDSQNNNESVSWNSNNKIIENNINNNNNNKNNNDNEINQNSVSNNNDNNNDDGSIIQFESSLLDTLNLNKINDKNSKNNNDNNINDRGETLEQDDDLRSICDTCVNNDYVGNNSWQRIYQHLQQNHKLLSLYTESYLSLQNPKSKSRIILNVSGKKFEIDTISLLRESESVFEYLFNNLNPLPDELFIDRDNSVFDVIAEYLQYGTVAPQSIPSDPHAKSLLKEEAQYFGLCYFEEVENIFRYPIESLGQKNINIKCREDVLRSKYASDRNDPLLNDPHVLLHPVFSDIPSFGHDDDDPIHSLPMVFSGISLAWDAQDTNVVSGRPTIVSNASRFKDQFHDFTQDILKGMDWSNIVVAGGCVLGCLLEQPLNQVSLDSITLDDIHQSSFKHASSLSSSLSWLNMENSDYETYSDTNTNTNTEDDTSDYYSTDEEEAQDEEVLLNMVRSKDPNGGALHRHQYDYIHRDKYDFGPWKDSDIDIFLYAIDTSEAIETIRHIYDVIKQNIDNQDIFILRTENAITFQPPYPYRLVQVILRLYKSPAEVLAGFDIDSVTVCYDGDDVWATSRARRAISTAVNLIDIDRQSTSYEYRLLKYAKRGFKVAVPGLDRSLIPPERIATGTGLSNLIDMEKKLHKKIKASLFSHKTKSSLKTDDTFDFNLTDANTSDYADTKINNLKPTETPFRTYEAFEDAAEYEWRQVIISKTTFSLSDLEYIIDPPLPSKDRISFVTVDPGSQLVGSFKPVSTNFYSVYHSSHNISSSSSSSSSPSHHYHHNNNSHHYRFYFSSWRGWHPYEEKLQRKLRHAYHMGKDVCRLNETRFVVFSRRQEYSTQSSSRSGGGTRIMLRTEHINMN